MNKEGLLFYTFQIEGDLRYVRKKIEGFAKKQKLDH
jgi:hypothetical protein